jgi:multiple antibiotic resistance protein
MGLEDSEDRWVGVVAGPGAITSVIISFQTSGVIVTIVSISIVIAITFLMLF